MILIEIYEINFKRNNRIVCIKYFFFVFCLINLANTVGCGKYYIWLQVDSKISCNDATLSISSLLCGH